jgi:hypothetical protein
MNRRTSPATRTIVGPSRRERECAMPPDVTLRTLVPVDLRDD